MSYPYDPNNQPWQGGSQQPQPGAAPQDTPQVSYNPSQYDAPAQPSYEQSFSQPTNEPAYDPSLSPYGPSSGAMPAQTYGPASGALPSPPYTPAPAPMPMQPAYGAAPAFGPAGGPPPKSNKPWIIGAAVLGLLAIAATVLFVVLGKDDKKNAKDDGSSTSSSEDNTTALVNSFDGGWTMTGTIKELSEPLYRPDDTEIGVGDDPFDATVELSITTSPCDAGKDCTATGTFIGEYKKDDLEFTLQDGKWVANTTEELYCDTDKKNSSITDIVYEIEAKKGDTLTGTRTVTDKGECGTPFKEVDDIEMSKK